MGSLVIWPKTSDRAEKSEVGHTGISQCRLGFVHAGYLWPVTEEEIPVSQTIAKVDPKLGVVSIQCMMLDMMIDKVLADIGNSGELYISPELWHQLKDRALELSAGITMADFEALMLRCEEGAEQLVELFEERSPDHSVLCVDKGATHRADG